MRPTILDVAARAGVSKTLVSFVLNDRPGVALETRERVLTAAHELGWTPNVRARSLSVSRAFAFGLVIERHPRIMRDDPFFPAFISGLEVGLAPAGCALVLSVVESEAAGLEAYRRMSSAGRVDGVILTDLRHDDPRVALCVDLGLPAVTLGRPAGGSPFTAVCMDDEAGIEDAVAHLTALGHTRIAHVAGPGQMLHAARRRDAFLAAAASAGVGDAPVVESDFTAVGGAQATEALLALSPRPTAIVYANDPMAIAGMRVAARMGIRVPDELSITGFDGSEIGEHLHPSLSTASADAVGWGTAVAETLLRLVEHGWADDVDLPPAVFIPRESSGPVPRSPDGAAAVPTKETP